ncbi:MAG: hypothetical protein WBH24_05150, partial [Candidatus Acidiferrum sp.]
MGAVRSKEASRIKESVEEESRVKENSCRGCAETYPAIRCVRLERDPAFFPMAPKTENYLYWGHNIS